MEILEINQTEELIKCINDLPNSYIFRGQPDSSWHLQTTLERACGNKFNKDLQTNVNNIQKMNFPQDSTYTIKKIFSQIVCLNGLLLCNIMGFLQDF